MSVQETNLKAIADAIRARDGSTGVIPAKDFPARIRAIPGGGGPSAGGIEVLENWKYQVSTYAGSIRAANFNQIVPVDMGIAILEGYV